MGNLLPHLSYLLHKFVEPLNRLPTFLQTNATDGLYIKKMTCLLQQMGLTAIDESSTYL